MNRLLWLFSFAVGAPCTLAAAILLFFTYRTTPVPQILSYSTARLYEASTNTTPTISTQAIPADARTHIISQYLTRFKSPLAPLSQYIVAVSDKYSLDFRLLTAIAQQESNLCKKIPPDSHNCWGFGIYGDKVTRFDSYEEAIETVAKTLKKKYIDQGLISPEEIMVKYTPPSLANGGSWARGVNQFLADMQ